MATSLESTPLIKDRKISLSKKSDDVMPSVVQAKQQATSFHITMNLIACGLGTGVFTLPWSTAGASIVPAFGIIALVLAVNAWTISIIVEAAERHQTFDLGSLLGCLPGRIGQVSQYVCNMVVTCSMFLGLVGYIIVIVDCAESYMLDIGTLSTNIHHRAAVVMLASVFVLPLCFLDQRQMSFTSGLAIAANANIFAFLLTTFAVEETNGSRPPVCYFGLGRGSMAMVSAMMQVIVIQMCVLPMYKELENRSPAKFNRIVVVSFGILFLICSGFAIGGYAAFGDTVQSNLLKNLPATSWGHISRLAAVAAVSAVFPIVMSAITAPFWNSEACTNIRTKYPFVAPTFFTVTIVMGVMVVSLFVTDLGFVNVVNGAISLGAFVGVVTPLIGLYLCGPKSGEAWWRATMYILAVVGLVGAGLGLTLIDNYASEIKSACMWPQMAQTGGAALQRAAQSIVRTR